MLVLQPRAGHPFPCSAAARKVMKSQAHEAFASAGQDSSSLKSCPSPGRAVLKRDPHAASVP